MVAAAGAAGGAAWPALGVDAGVGVKAGSAVVVASAAAGGAGRTFRTTRLSSCNSLTLLTFGAGDKVAASGVGVGLAVAAGDKVASGVGVGVAVAAGVKVASGVGVGVGAWFSDRLQLTARDPMRKRKNARRQPLRFRSMVNKSG